MSDDPPIEPMENPVATDAVARTLAPYATLLPAEVISALAMLTTEALRVHPAGISLVARLSPGLQATVDMSEDWASQNQQSFSFGEMMRVTLRVVRRRARERGEKRFLMPDTPLLMLQAFLGYLGADDTMWTASDDLVRTALDSLCNAIAGALFMGLVLDLQSAPSMVADWGETGGALSQVLPRMTATLKDALSRMPKADRQLLANYQSCGWDIKRLSKRLHSNARATTRGFEAFVALGAALLLALSAATPS